MKKIFLIIFLLIVAYEAYPQIRLSTVDSVTTFQPTDIFWLNTKSSGLFVNRKVSWSYLRSNMADYIDGLANTWALRQTFSRGATFSAANYGSTIFYDSLCVVDGAVLAAHYIRPYLPTTGYIGDITKPFTYVYSRWFVAVNSTGTDTAYITLNDDGRISIPNLSVTESIKLDSGTVFNSFILGVDSYSPSTVADTIITLIEGASPVVSFILPGNLTTGISRFLAKPATTGQIVILRNATVPYTIKLIDYVGNDDNLYLSGDFTMGYNDIITLMCISEEPAQQWVEVSRSNN